MDNKLVIANGIFNSKPTLLGRLAGGANPAEVADILNGIRADVERACRDAGLMEITPDEAVQLFTTGKPLAAKLREALVSLPVHATPQILRLTVASMLKRQASQIQEV